MQKKLLLVDGHNLLFQMFYGMPNKIEGKNGKHIEGIWGFTGALLKIINIIEPTHICVIFDGEQTLYRSKEFENYKQNRIDYSKVEEEKNPFTILPDIKNVLKELNIAFFETEDGYVTDDYMKEYCKTYESSCDIVISSWDYDYISLVSDKINLLTYKGKNSVLYTKEKVLSKWKVEPEYFADYKALVGDASDSIAGIPRIGPKMASQLIQEFGHVESILEHIEDIKKENIRLTLDIFQKELLQNIKLIRLNGTGTLPFLLEQLDYSYGNVKTKEVLIRCDLLEPQGQPA